MSEARNYIFAIVLSMIAIFIWQMFFIPKNQPVKQTAQQQVENSGNSSVPVPGDIPVTQGGVVPGDGTQPLASVKRSRSEILNSSKRAPIKTTKLTGSINLRGARIDDLTLSEYHTTTNPDSKNIVLFSPSGSNHPYYTEFGFTSNTKDNKAWLPGSETVWSVKGNAVLTDKHPLVLTYTSKRGVVFTRKIAITNGYLFSIVDTIDNNSGSELAFYEYGVISRHETPETQNFYILHEGAIGVLGDEALEEVSYADMLEDKTYTFTGTRGGWLGMTDKYWAATLIPNNGEKTTAKFRFTGNEQQPRYQTDYIGSQITIAPGESKIFTKRLFAGAKEVSVIDDIEKQYGILNFDRLIDWGWFYFITKPLFYLIDFFYKFFSNFGLAILSVTVLVKLAFFPLANKSYVSMANMKKVQPQIMALRERYKDDRQQQQKAMMELYKKEKINPLAGCLPIVIQIPVFFAIYKVLFVTIEMRHAPFFGWIQDLAAPDPTTIFNLFGLIPWDPPNLMMVGIWPIIMGITMFVQMSLNPPPADPTQQFIFKWMPLFFTFLLARFPAGLVIYWAWNNTLSVTQQYLIMRRQGVEVSLWQNIAGKLKSSSSKDGKKASTPTKHS